MPTLIDLTLGDKSTTARAVSEGSTLEAFPFELWDQVLNEHVDGR